MVNLRAQEITRPIVHLDHAVEQFVIGAIIGLHDAQNFSARLIVREFPTSERALVAHMLTRCAAPDKAPALLGELSRVLAVVLMSAGSFYLSIPYSESLFLLLVVGTMAAARKGRYELAGLLAGAAATTRAHGLALKDRFGTVNT